MLETPHLARSPAFEQLTSFDRRMRRSVQTEVSLENVEPVVDEMPIF